MLAVAHIVSSMDIGSRLQQQNSNRCMPVFAGNVKTTFPVHLQQYKLACPAPSDLSKGYKAHG